MGDIDDSLSLYATSLDKSAQLITSKNFRNLSSGTYYTSLGDLTNLNEFADVLRQADEIIYCPSKSWSDGRLSQSNMKQWTEDYLKIFSCDRNKKVVGFSVQCDDLAAMTHLVDQRKTQHQQIWIAGCSISHGIGVDLKQRYGHLISQELGLEASFLTKSGSSVAWAADQLMRSDIRPGDMIFWGLTSINRFTYWNESEKQIVQCPASHWDNQKSYLGNFIKKNFLASDILIGQSVNAVMQVVNYCDKIGARLVLATLMAGMEQYIKHIPNFLLLAGMYGRDPDNMFLDTGNDGVHPGIESHQHYADQMLKKYNQLYGVK